MASVPLSQRAAAAARRAFQPGLWAHLLRLANAAAYSHSEQRARMTTGSGLAMAPSVSLRNGERLELGREVHVGERCSLWAGDSSGRIVLGDNALLAPEVFITASNYGTRWGTGVSIMYQSKAEADVHVGADVWLGVRVTVLPGVRIGAGAVVAAGAVVTKDLPSGCIAGGVPAKVIGWREGVPDAMRATPEHVVDVSGASTVLTSAATPVEQPAGKRRGM